MTQLLRTEKKLFAAALVLGVVFAGCKREDKPAEGSGPAAGGASGTAGATPGDGPILVGEYSSMTGAEATFGQSTHNGIMLAVEEVNAAGGIKGRKVEIKLYDTQGKTQEAGTAVTRLITQDKVTAVLGEVASSLSLAGGAVAQQFGVPMVTPSSTNERVTKIGDMIFRVCFIDPFQGYVMAKFSRDNLKAAKVAVLYDQSQAYSKGLKDAFVKSFTEMGGEIASEQAYNKGDSDFNAQLANIRDAKPDAIFIPGYYTDVGNIALQARKLGITAPLMGGDGWDSSELPKIAGEAIEGGYFSNHYSHEEQRPEVQNFVKAYQAKYSAVPDGLAAMGYDAARLLFDAMKRAASLSGKDLAQAIGETKDYASVTGKITIDAGRNARKPAVVLQIKGGKHAYVATIDPK